MVQIFISYLQYSSSFISAVVSHLLLKVTMLTIIHKMLAISFFP